MVRCLGAVEPPSRIPEALEQTLWVASEEVEIAAQGFLK
jgi:hypothetical protein